MKKLLSMAMACLIAVVAFTSCDKKNDDGTVSADAIKVQAYQANYYGDYYKNNSHNFDMYLHNGLTFTQSSTGVTISGTGNLYYIDLISATVSDLYPALTTYPASENFDAPSFVSGYEYDYGKDQFGDAYAGIMVIPVGTYKVTFEDDKSTDTLYVVSGTIIVEASRLIGNFTYNDGSKESIVVDSKITFEDQSPSEDDAYEFESTTVSTQNYTYSDCKIESQTGVYSIQLTGTDIMASIYVFVDENATSPVGTYTFSDTEAPGTALKSAGASGNSVYPSFAGTTVVQDGTTYIQDVYFLVSGTITVAETGVTLAAKSYFGSTINGTYSGSISSVPAQSSIVKATIARNQNIEMASQPFNTKKIMRGIK